MRGSSQSRQASPSKLKARTAIITARAGKTTRCGGLNQNGLENIRQQMARHDSHRRCAKRARGEDEFEFFHLQNLRASEARVACPTSDDQRKNDFADAGTEKCRKGDGQ